MQSLGWLVAAILFSASAAVMTWTSGGVLAGGDGFIRRGALLLIGTIAFTLVSLANTSIEMMVAEWRCSYPTEVKEDFVIAARRGPWVAAVIWIGILVSALVFGFFALFWTAFGHGPEPIEPMSASLFVLGACVPTWLVPSQRWGVATLTATDLQVTWGDGTVFRYSWLDVPTLEGFVRPSWKLAESSQWNEIRTFGFIGSEAARGYELAHHYWALARVVPEQTASTASYRSNL